MTEPFTRLFECVSIKKHERLTNFTEVGMESVRNKVETLVILAPAWEGPGDIQFVVGKEYILTIEEDK